MGFFKSLFGDRIQNENRSKPFYMNKNHQERKDWFSRTHPWNRLDSEVIDALIDKFGEDQMFEVFVLISMKLNLVAEYELVNKQNYHRDIICSVIASKLCKVGGDALRRIMAQFDGHKDFDEIRNCYGIVRDTLETAIILDSNQLSTYAGMAFVLKLFDKDEEAAEYAKRGIKTISEIKMQNVPYHLSQIPEISNFPQHMDALEESLKKVLVDCGQDVV